MSKYYVYSHRRKSTNEIFYIGKGCGRRAKCKNRNDKWSKISAHGYTIDYLITGLNEEEAFELEELCIEFLKPSCNFNLGGDCGPAMYGKDNPNYISFISRRYFYRIRKSLY